VFDAMIKVAFFC